MYIWQATQVPVILVHDWTTEHDGNKPSPVAGHPAGGEPVAPRGLWTWHHVWRRICVTKPAGKHHELRMACGGRGSLYRSHQAAQQAVRKLLNHAGCSPLPLWGSGAVADGQAGQLQLLGHRVCQEAEVVP